MAFINKHSSIRIHTHLTQEGKKRLADGDMRIERIAFSDAEIDYSCGSGITYSSILNNITAMPYRKGGVVSMNYDGTSPYPLDPNNVISITEVTGEPVPNLGFYDNILGTNELPGYRFDTSLCIATGWTPTQFNLGVFGQTPQRTRFILCGATSIPPEEGILFARFVAPYGSAIDEAGPNIGYYANFYRYFYDSGTSIVHVDRALPRYDAYGTIKEQPLMFYPLSGYSQYYGSGTTTVCPIWNMNIYNRVTHIAGSESSGVMTFPSPDYFDLSYPNTLHENNYGSRHVAGLVKSFGLDHLPRCAIIHYSNSYSGDVYGDYLMPRETEVDIPHILWHRNGSGLNGTSLRGGIKLIDAGSEIFYDTTGKTSYTILKDGIGPNAQVVGRVYFEMKTIVLTDQELITALDAKNNRNYTWPPMKVELVSTTSNPLISAGGYTGLAEQGKRYYVTYQLSSYPGAGPRQGVPCSYIQVIDGQNDDDGNPMYIKGTFPPNSFPFLRSHLNAFSGAGGHADGVHMIVQEVDNADDTGILGLSPFKWLIAPTGVYGVSRFGNIGISTYISATQMNAFTFYATREEMDGSNYFNMSEFTFSTGIGQSLYPFDREFWHGDTEMFFGNITAKKVRKSYVRSVRFFIEKDYLNTTTNFTYTSGSTFISEIYLLGGDNKILGIGKPDRPIEKNDTIMIDLALNSYY